MSVSLYIATELTKRFGRKVVIDKLSFEIYEKEFVYLKGPNGSGKTTLLNIIAKFDNNWSGELKFKGTSLKKIKLNDYPISYIPDEPIFYEGLTVKEHLNFIASMYMKKEDAKEVTSIYINLFGLNEYLDYFPYQLSKGNKQKVMLCCALLKSFEVFIADEPFNFLDSDSIKTLIEILLMMKKTGKTIILSSHEVGYIKNLIDREIQLVRRAE